MLTEAMAATAAAGGMAVVQAAGTDAWAGIRSRVARLLGHAEPAREQMILDRLDETALVLVQVEPFEAQAVRAHQADSWQVRFQDLLKMLDEPGQEDLAAELSDLQSLARDRTAEAVRADSGGLAAGGDIHIQADSGSVSAGVIHGNVQIGNPQMPGPVQG